MSQSELGRVHDAAEAAAPSVPTAFLDRLPVAVFTLGPDRRIRRMNPAAARLLGIDPSSAPGRRCDEVFGCDSCDEGCGAEAAFATGEASVGSPVVAHPSGAPAIAFRIDAVPIAADEVAVVLYEVAAADPPGHDERMKEALRRAAGSVTKAARLLDVHRTTLWRWMGAAGIDRKDFFP
jgi:PAS domain-containing protein